MAKPNKAAQIERLTELFRNSQAVLLTEYRGLSVGQMKTLRQALGENAVYTVAKNTLAKLAAKEVGYDFLAEDLSGPTALTFVKGEPVDVAKALRDFAKENKALVVKSGVMDGAPLTAAAVTKLADLESREVLLAKAAGALKAKMVQAAYMFKAPAVKTVRTVDALRDKQEKAA